MKKSYIFGLVILVNWMTAQTISFESSEGYTLGNINGQNGWAALNFDNVPTDIQIVNSLASQGVNSVRAAGVNSQKIYYLNKTLPGTATEVSFDFRVDSNTSTFGMKILDQSGQNSAAAFFSYPGSNWFVQLPDGSYSPTSYSVQPVWQNFKCQFNFTTHKVKYYINNSFINEYDLDASLSSLGKLEFTYQDLGSGFYLDNLVTVTPLVLATADNKKNDQVLKIAPIPADENISISGTDQITSVEIYDAAGKLMLKENSGEKNVNISSLPSGNYIVNVISNGKKTSQKIIKK